MEPHKTYQLYADLYENGRKINFRDLSEDEQTAVICELEDLWMDAYAYDAYKCQFIATPSVLPAAKSWERGKYIAESP